MSEATAVANQSVFFTMSALSDFFTMTGLPGKPERPALGGQVHGPKSGDERLVCMRARRAVWRSSDLPGAGASGGSVGMARPSRCPHGHRAYAPRHPQRGTLARSPLQFIGPTRFGEFEERICGLRPHCQEGTAKKAALRLWLVDQYGFPKRHLDLEGSRG